MTRQATCERTSWMERPFMDYLAEVDWLLQSIYGITTDDTDLDMVAAAQEAGETPQGHVDWIAQHYDLEPIPQ